MTERKRINVFQPTLGDEETEAVREVFESGWIGRGPRTESFEQAFAQHIGVERPCVRSITSCTEGLFVCMELAGVGDGDEVILPTISFVGAANAIASTGAKPVFCDVDRRTLNARVQDIEAKLTPRTKAIVILHYGGVPGDVEEIAALARDRGILLVEDTACSVASRIGDRACGTFGDMAVWSFDAMKILVAGDGGMVYVRDPDVAARLPQVTYLGLETASGLSAASSSRDRWWEFDISSFSRRAIINDVTAAIGLVQLRKLPEFVERRRRVSARYADELAGIEWLELPPEVPSSVSSSYYLFWVQVARGLRDELARFLLDRGIYTTFRYYPLHLVDGYGARTSLPQAERAAHETLCLPLHQALEDADVDRVVEALHAFGSTAANAASAA